MSEWDPIFDPPERRRRSPIVPMRPYVEPKPEVVPQPLVSDRSKSALGRLAAKINVIWHDIVDEAVRRND
jgi:hypothetical protein